MDDTLTSTITPDQSTPHSPDIQHWSLTIRCSKVSHSIYHIFGGSESYPYAVDTFSVQTGC